MRIKKYAVSELSRGLLPVVAVETATLHARNSGTNRVRARDRARTRRGLVISREGMAGR